MILRAESLPRRLCAGAIGLVLLACTMGVANAETPFARSVGSGPAASAEPAPPAAPCASAESALPPEPLSPWSGVDAEIEFLVARGDLPVEALSFRPIDRGELAGWLATAARGSSAVAAAEACAAGRRGTLIRFEDAKRRLTFSPYARVMPTFARGSAPHWSDSTRLGFRAVYQVGSALSMTTGFYAAEVAESAGFADPLIAHTDLILHADEVTLSARFAGLRLRLGRDRHRWGPGASGTLLLAESAAPFDFVEYQCRVAGRLRFLALTGETSRAAGGDSAWSYAGRIRYLSAHRLQWDLSPRFTLALSEGARYQRSSPPLLYLAGILPYTLVERLEMQDESSDAAEDFLRNNVLWSLDAVWRPRPGWMVYGEILIDDVATKTDEMPTRGGAQIGCTFAPRWRGWDWTLGAELTRVSSYTYSVYYQNLCQCDWEHQEDPIGYARGPDVALLLLRAGAIPSRAWQGRGWLEILHKGAGALGEPWKPASTGCDAGADPDCGEVDPWTLTSPVTRRLALGGELRFRPDPLLWLGGSLEWRTWTRDASAQREQQTRLRLFVSAGM